MNLSNYQVSQRSGRDAPKTGHHPSLCSQYHDSLRTSTSYVSDVTICCRIKRPFALGSREAKHDKVKSNSALSMNSKRSGGSTRRNNNNLSTLRSSSQSLMQNQLSSVQSVKSMHSIQSNTSRKNSSTKRSASLLQIYSSNTGRSLTRNSATRPASRTTAQNSKQPMAIRRKSLHGTGTFGVAQSRLNRSIVSSKSDLIKTPISKHSRKSSGALHVSASQKAAAIRTKQPSKFSSIDQKEEPLQAESCSFQIFSTVDDSPYVVCVPPLAST